MSLSKIKRYDYIYIYIKFTKICILNWKYGEKIIIHEKEK